jgi:hypothetical protein
MQDGSRFIGNHPTTSYHPNISDGTANSVYRNNVKVRRTYGWDCPFDDYKSTKWFNVQRHINAVHGWGSGVPVDSRTGETKEDKVSNATLQRNLPNNLVPPYSRSNSIGSARSDTEFEDKPGEKVNEAVPPAGLSSPAWIGNVRMPYLESQEERVQQLGYHPSSGLRNNYHGQINRPTSYYERSVSSSRAGNYPNASKLQDENPSYWDRSDLNGLQGTQEYPSANSLTTYHTYQSGPFNPQYFLLRQMQQLLDLFK